MKKPFDRRHALPGFVMVRLDVLNDLLSIAETVDQVSQGCEPDTPALKELKTKAKRIAQACRFSIETFDRSGAIVKKH